MIAISSSETAGTMTYSPAGKAATNLECQPKEVIDTIEALLTAQLSRLAHYYSGALAVDGPNFTAAFVAMDEAITSCALSMIERLSQQLP